MKPDIIYHIVDKKTWKECSRMGEYTPPSLAEDAEGFIHCSTGRQVNKTANRFFKDKSGLLLIVIATAQLSSTLKYEDTMGHGEQFPHIYGPLNLNAVLDTLSLIPEADGSFDVDIQEID